MFRCLYQSPERIYAHVEQYSIDEAFMDMSSTLHLFGNPAGTAMRIRDRIREELGFTVNIGISSNKLLAKDGQRISQA